MSKPLSALHRLAISTASSLLLLSSAVSYADDTEIFFGGPAIDDSVRPNVLFVLDNSGSMAWRTTSNSNPSGSEQSRLQILKDSFSSIISNAGAINAGVIMLNSLDPNNSDGRMLYPVTNIDSSLPSDGQQVASTPQILISADDATQSSLGGGAAIATTSLPMGYISTTTATVETATSTLGDIDAFFQSRLSNIDWACRLSVPGNDHATANDACGTGSINDINIRASGDTNAANQNPARGTALLYFRSLNIPAAVQNDPSFAAYLELRPINTPGGGAPAVSVTMQDSKTPGALNDLTQVDPGRTYLASTNITASGWNSSSTTRLNVTTLVKEILNNDTNALQSVFLKLRATSSSRDYTFCARNCGDTNGVSNAPRLVFSYAGTAIQDEARTGALRFQNVGIPRGATITSARLDFAPAATNGDALTLKVKAGNLGDAAAFVAGAALPTARTTALTNWAVPAWANQSPSLHLGGPDVTSLVQEVVNLSSWCGNNAMAFYLEPNGGSGSRTAHSIDGAPGLQPTLTITYTGGESGCLNPIIETSVTNPKNDAYEEDADAMVLGDTTLPVDRNRFAARYENIPIRQGATILDAQVILTPANTVSNANASTSLRFHNVDDSIAFTSVARNLSGRPSTATTSTCTLTSWTTDSPVVCSGAGLVTALQSVINRTGWTAGNALTLMAVQGSDSNLAVKAYESNPAQSVKLRIKVASGGLSSTTRTVRDQLNALVQTMTTGAGGTPIVPTMYEAAQYMRGNRSGYSNPITSACQSTHLVVLTDGQANGNGAQSSIGSLIGSSCTADASDSDEQCGRSLATWMGNTDQSSFDGDNFITTHTIGFALGALAPNTAPQSFLTRMAQNGGGKAYTAENAGELSAAFSQILQDVISTDTTFVSPGATVNQFNRESNKNEVYFALFKPSETNRWVGNLKRYALNSTAGDLILDADGVGAIDASTGFFKSSARSFWTTGNDGNNTTLGGVANKLPLHGSRKAYTYLGTSPATPVNLNNSAYLLNDANTAVTTAKLGDSSMSTSERTTLINWLRGLNDDGSARKAIGDPLHSVPRLVSYECTAFTDTSLTDCATEEQSVFMGTNEGFIHAFNTNTGEEQMAFMPEALLGNIKKLKANGRSTSLAPRQYGMDNTVAVWTNDINKNGVIYGGRDPASTSTPPGTLSGLNSGEFVYLYASMGRGGRNLYSLDVTDIANPKMRWFITPNTSGFARLGQTWSTPVVTKLKIGTTETPVLVFAGGYDEAQDDVTIRDWNGTTKAVGSARAEDAQGNAIYIVNALTGALIWSGSREASNSGAQAHQTLNKMKYSMPSSVRVIDLNRDGMADQFFVGDMGGQVWRFFINNGSAVGNLVSPADSGAGTAEDGVFASVTPADVNGETDDQLKSKLRRFYNEPDVALLTVDSGKALVVNIGSGYRGHPLDTHADDRFYSFRTPIIDTNASHTILTESLMYDATYNLVQEGSASEKTAAASAFNQNSGGWYIKLNENDGEKVLSRAATFASKVFFSTYAPGNSNVAASCKAVQGTGRSYAVNLFDATPIEQRIIDSADRSDRTSILMTMGIPPDPVILFPEGNPKGALGFGTEFSELDGDFSVGPTYWINEK